MSDIAELAVKADAFKAVKDKRLALQRDVDALKEQETTLKRELIEAFTSTEGLKGVVGSTCTVKLRTTTKAQVADWDAFWKYIFTTGETELVQRRPSDRAIKERWEDDVEVPGVIGVEVDDLSVTKS